MRQLFEKTKSKKKVKGKKRKAEKAVTWMEASQGFLAGLERSGLLGLLFALAVLDKAEIIPYVVIVFIFSKTTLPG